MQKDTFYIIDVFGKKPVPVEIGHINKRSGMPEPNPTKATMEVGEYACPNYSTAWAKLLRGSDKKLTGEIQFLPWGDPQGESIEIRYLRNCNSISMAYQEEKKLKVTDDQAEIMLKIGKNTFNESLHKLLVYLLKHHGLNRSNKSRNPENRRTTFETYKAPEEKLLGASELLNRQHAESVVLDAYNSSADLPVLAALFDVDPQQSKEDLFNTLAMYSQNPKQFFEVLKGHATDYKDILVKAAELELIKFDSEGNVKIIIGGKKDLLMDGVEGANIDEQIDYVTDNITKAKYYQALDRLAGELQKFKNLVLQ